MVGRFSPDPPLWGGAVSVAWNENALVSREMLIATSASDLHTKGTSRVKPSHSVRAVFDDANLASSAGLVPALDLAQAAGLHELLETRLSVDSPNRAAKASSVIGGMLAGADCIDDLDLL